MKIDLGVENGTLQYYTPPPCAVGEQITKTGSTSHAYGFEIVTGATLGAGIWHVNVQSDIGASSTNSEKQVFCEVGGGIGRRGFVMDMSPYRICFQSSFVLVLTSDTVVNVNTYNVSSSAISYSITMIATKIG